MELSSCFHPRQGCTHTKHFDNKTPFSTRKPIEYENLYLAYPPATDYLPYISDPGDCPLAPNVSLRCMVEYATCAAFTKGIVRRPVVAECATHPLHPSGPRSVMTRFDPSASVSSLAPTTTEATATPAASTANLLPSESRSDTDSRTSASSEPATSRTAPPTPTPRSQTYPSNPSKPPKDYEQAFATLSSAWGFGAHVPAKNPKSDKDEKDKKEKKEKQPKKDKQKASQSVSSPPSSSSSGQSSGSPPSSSTQRQPG
ncbi:hypothetical protein LXA43DRAFT_1063292 [Ganoderma leucocontextum]|nr:hypothetical protein LXA43DRAFT_1063292 [Ganoderma leucocontextum]